MTAILSLVGYVPPRCEINVTVEPPKVTCNFEGAKIKIEGNYIIIEAP